jgi:hypothetical protein
MRARKCFIAIVPALYHHRAIDSRNMCGVAGEVDPCFTCLLYVPPGVMDISENEDTRRDGWYGMA